MKSHRIIPALTVVFLAAGILFAQGQRGGAPPAGQAAPGGAAQGGRGGGGGRGGNQTPDTVFIEEMTWEEVRDAIAAGKTGVVVPTGGTEKNGYHMVLGKHNYVVTHGAELIARKLGTALVAPTLQYVPEGNPDSQGPGVLSHPSPMFDRVLEAAARSLRVHGFKDIMLIGDSGGNQGGLRAAAEKLNKEWEGTDVKVFALTDHYEGGREHYRAWLLAAFGYDDQIIGSHAGISDTSQMLWLRPSGIRLDQIKPYGGARDSGVSGDPSKATPEIGRMGVQFKANAAIAQYRALKAPAGGRGGRGAPTTTPGRGGRGPGF